VPAIRVRHAGALLEFGDHEAVAFGRSRTRPDDTIGWGFPGRFIELSPSDEIHRVWGAFVPSSTGWAVRSLGALHPVVVLRSGYDPVRLEPFGQQRRSSGAVPDELGVGAGPFAVHLHVPGAEWVLDCAVDGTPTAPDIPLTSGAATVNVGEQVAAGITLLEYRVLWAMSADRRSGRSSRPVSYTRIERLLGLDSRRQAVAAVERLTRRFRELGLIPPGTSSDEQRLVICGRAEELGVLDALRRRYGEAG